MKFVKKASLVKQFFGFIFLSVFFISPSVSHAEEQEIRMFIYETRYESTAANYIPGNQYGACYCYSISPFSSLGNKRRIEDVPNVRRAEERCNEIMIENNSVLCRGCTELFGGGSALSSDSASTGSVAGEWSWFNGGTVTLTTDGHILSNGKQTGTYTCAGNVCKLKWNGGKYIDTLRLSNDGEKLDGKNQNGTHVWAKKDGKL